MGTACAKAQRVGPCLEDSRLCRGASVVGAKWKGKRLQRGTRGVTWGLRDHGAEDVRASEPSVTQSDAFFNIITGLWHDV